MSNLADQFKNGGASHAPEPDPDEQLGEVIPADGLIAETAAALNDAAGDRVSEVQWSMDRFVAPQSIIKAATLPEASAKVTRPAGTSSRRTSAASATPHAAGADAKPAPAERRGARTTKEKAGRTRQASEVKSRAGRDGGKPAEKLASAKDGAEDLGGKTT